MDDMADSSGRPGGLRARKRAATQAAIEKIAIDLAIEHGYEHVTVDMICEAGMVSQRTFFNYFGSKEGVILGPTPVMVTDAGAERFIAGRGDILLELVLSIAESLLAGQFDREVMQQRFLIITSSPELLAKQMEWMSAREDELVDLVITRFAAEGRRDSGDSAHREEAEVLVGLAFAVLKHTLQPRRVAVDGIPAVESFAHSVALARRVVAGTRR